MKPKLIYVVLLIVITNLNGQTFQNNITNNLSNFHDLNLDFLDDNSDDFIVSANSIVIGQDISPTLMRVNQNGIIVWMKEYNLGSQTVRFLDIVTYFDLVYVTGYKIENGTKRVFVAKIEALNGNVLDVSYYDIVSTNFNSTGFHISFTDSDATGDNNPNPGIIVAGYFSDCFTIDPNSANCNNNIGFVMRTDLNLNLLWTIEVDTNIANNQRDYDFVNNITETNDGFLLTGSSTQNPGGSQQAVLAHKIDFQGNFIWDKSYVLGNSNDVSVDAYYNVSTNEIFMLTNYSSTHYFGITVFDNSTGTINNSKSWFAGANDENRFGFSIMESISNSNNLIITGYDRNENWTSSNNNPLYGESTVFIMEFEKSTGNAVGGLFQFLVPHVEITGDEFNFWTGLLPLIYYPDLSAIYTIPGNQPNYFLAGYKSFPVGSITKAVLYKTTGNKRNDCINIEIPLTKSSINITSSAVISGSTPNTKVTTILSNGVINYSEDYCDPTLAINDINEIDEIILYPNPTSSNLYISNTIVEKYEIYDSLGRIVGEGKIDNNNSIQVIDLAKGIYFVKLFDNKNNTKVLNFIKK